MEAILNKLSEKYKSKKEEVEQIDIKRKLESDGSIPNRMKEMIAQLKLKMDGL